MGEASLQNQIVSRLRTLYDDEPDEEVRAKRVRAWLEEMNPDLGLARPTELMRSGRAVEVLELVEDLIAWNAALEDQRT